MIKEALIKDACIDDLETINRFLKELNVRPINGDELLDHPFSKYVILTDEEEIIGFMNYSIIYEHMELNFIFVEPKFRKKGYASLMMKYLIDLADKIKSDNITLEVAIHNIGAINLYVKHGFKHAATRKNYYGHEDGLLMIRKLVSDES